MVPGAHVLVQIIARTAVIYMVVLLGVRLSGKREVGQMLNRPVRGLRCTSATSVCLRMAALDASDVLK